MISTNLLLLDHVYRFNDDLGYTLILKHQKRFRSVGTRRIETSLDPDGGPVECRRFGD